MTDMERAEQRRQLDDFANANAVSNQPVPHGHALVRPTQGLAERVIGAQPVAVYRDEGKIFEKLSQIAARAGTDWFYRYPVRKKIVDESGRETWGTDFIEGPSIKLANDVARIFGNNVNEIREVDVGDAWVFYARFTDIETGFSMERAYHQRKSQASIKSKDYDRQLDIAYQIGQSKAIRNCIVNSLQLYADFAFEEARDSLVQKIGKDLPAWRARTIDGLKKIPVDVARVDRVIGRPSKDWLAPDVAQVVAMMRTIHDGMASLDEVFPPLGAAQHEETQPQTEAAPAATAEKADQTQSAAQETDPALIAAYERGKADRRKGMQRKAPVEYRSNDRAAEMAAWLKGWDEGGDATTQ